MSQEATYRNNRGAAYNGGKEGGEKQEDGIESIVRSVQRIHDGVFGYSDRSNGHMQRIYKVQEDTKGELESFSLVVCPVISPDSRFIVTVVENTKNTDKFFEIRRIADHVVDWKPLFKCHDYGASEFKRYIFTADSRYLLCFHASTRVDIYDLEDLQSDPIPTSSYDLDPHLPYPEDSRIHTSNTSILSSHYYHHENLVDCKELKDHITLSNPTHMILFLQHSDGEDLFKPVLLKLNHLENPHTTDTPQFQDIVFTNLREVYKAGYDRWCFDVFRHNSLLVVSYNISSPGMCISTYSMYMKKREGVNIIDVKLQEKGHSRVFPDLHPFDFTPSTQYTFISYQYLHIVDQTTGRVCVFDLDDDDAIDCKTLWNPLPNHQRFSVLDDGQYIVWKDKRRVEIWFRQGEGYLPIYLYESDRLDGDIGHYTVSSDMRYMCITREKKQEWIVLQLYDHTSYNMKVNRTKYHSINYPSYRPTRGIEICFDRNIIRYLYLGNPPSDIDLQAYTSVTNQTKIQYIYDEHNKRIIVLYKQQSENDIHKLIIDVATNSTHSREDILSSNMIEEAHLQYSEHGYAYENSDRSITVQMFKDAMRVVLPSEYNDGKFVLCVGDGVVIIMRHDEGYRLFSLVWRDAGGGFDSVVVDTEVRLDTDSIYTNRGRVSRRAEVKYIAEGVIVVLHREGYLMVGRDKKVTDKRFTNAGHIMVSGDGRFVGVYDSAKKILLVQSTEERGNTRYVYDVRYREVKNGMVFDNWEVLEFSEDSTQVVVTRDNGDVEYVRMKDMRVIRSISNRYLGAPRVYDQNFDSMRVLSVGDGLLVVCGSIKSARNKPYTVSRAVNYRRDSYLIGVIQRYLSEVEKGPEDKKKSLQRTFINMVLSVYPHEYQHITVITIIVYMMNDEQWMSEYCGIVGIQTLISNHNIISLCFTYSQFDRSMHAVIKAISQYYTLNRSHVKIEDAVLKRLIIEKKDGLLRDDMCRKMLTVLLSSSYGDTISIQIQDEMHSMCTFEHDDDAFANSRSMNDSIVGERRNSLEKENGEHLTLHQTFVSLVRLDISTGTEYSRSIFRSFNNVSDEDFKTSYKSIVYFKWNSLFMYALVYSCVYWGMSVLSYVYFGDYIDSKALGIPILVLNLALLSSEARSALVDLREWVGSVWNWMDVVILLYSSISIIVFVSSEVDPDSLGATWVRISIVFLVGVRTITWLRIFRSTRYLITMVLQVFIDIVPFLVILTSVIFVFAFVWRFSPTLGYTDSQDTEGIKLSFYQSIYDSTGIIFGNSPQGDPSGERFTLIRFLVIIVGNVALALTLLNFLIAIISGTYEKINEDRDLHDVRELLSLIIEFDTLLYRKGKVGLMKYLMDVRPVDRYSLDERIDHIEMKIDDVKSGLGDQVQEMKKSMDSLSKKVEDKIEGVDRKIEKVMEYLELISEKIGGELNGKPYGDM